MNKSLKLYQKTPTVSANVKFHLEKNLENEKEKEKEKEKLMSQQRKEKLKEMLISKFMKKYEAKSNECQYLLHEEISKFLVGEKITDSDLKKLDNRLKEITTKNNKETSKILKKL